MAAFSAVSDSAGLSLLSKGTTSNFTPAALPAPLNFSAKKRKLLTWFWPTGAIRPDSGSIQAIFTVSPFWAIAPELAAASSAVSASERTVKDQEGEPWEQWEEAEAGLRTISSSPFHVAGPAGLDVERMVAPRRHHRVRDVH